MKFGGKTLRAGDYWEDTRDVVFTSDLVLVGTQLFFFTRVILAFLFQLPDLPYNQFFLSMSPTMMPHNHEGSAIPSIMLY